ncbi:MAG: hypothetical protein WCL27_01580, partial [Betaproteobacteria bacterium]
SITPQSTVLPKDSSGCDKELRKNFSMLGLYFRDHQVAMKSASLHQKSGQSFFANQRYSGSW